MIETKVEDNDVKDKNLENDEIGNDPDLPTNDGFYRAVEVIAPVAKTRVMWTTPALEAL